MKSGSIFDLAEDLLNKDSTQAVHHARKMSANPKRRKEGDTTSFNTVQSLVNETARILKIDSFELSEWLKASAVPKDVQEPLLKTVKRFRLNPLFGHIAWDPHPEYGAEVFITIDGWIYLIHREPSFRGVSFHPSPEMEHGIPVWMECRIYRADLMKPITVREYFVELKTDHPSWEQMPRRMMRHKTLQQCARLAFGIHVPELNDRKLMTRTSTLEKSVVHQQLKSMSSKQMLKEKLRSESIPSIARN